MSKKSRIIRRPKRYKSIWELRDVRDKGVPNNMWENWANEEDIAMACLEHTVKEMLAERSANSNPE